MQKETEILHTFLWFDLGYTCTMMHHENHACFSIFHIIKYNNRLPLYQTSLQNFENFTSDTMQAVCTLKGMVNQDDCLELLFKHAVHLCNDESIEKFNAMLLRVKKVGVEMMKGEY